MQKQEKQFNEWFITVTVTQVRFRNGWKGHWSATAAESSASETRRWTTCLTEWRLFIALPSAMEKPPTRIAFWRAIPMCRAKRPTDWPPCSSEHLSLPILVNRYSESAFKKPKKLSFQRIPWRPLLIVYFQPTLIGTNRLIDLNLGRKKPCHYFFVSQFFVSAYRTWISNYTMTTEIDCLLPPALIDS